MDLYPQALREAFFPPGSAYTASVHDVGKVSPTFQKKLYGSTGCAPPELESAPDPALERQWSGHPGAGQATLAACNAGKYLPEIVGRHHGSASDLNGHRSTDEALGGEAWHARRIVLLDALMSHFKETWPRIDSRANADILAGLTTVADWIASGPLFDDPGAPWEGGIDRAVREAGFVKADIVSGLSFSDVFSYDPYPAQKQFYGACLGPGVYILEAPMGLGKTEAALYAAYNLLCEDRATGIYFALPTRLTSNKIHQRMRAFLQKVLAPGSPHNQPLLLHAKARLMDNLQDTEMGEEGAPGGEWFNSLKRAILAPFGVGTLDQALLSALPDVRHSFVRSFGLLGKVVVLDEVHTYDAYTGLLLDALVESLRRLHCTVIILSATLTRERRAALLSSDTEREDYPLVSALALGSAHLCETPVPPRPDREVTLRACDAERDAFAEAVERSSQGQQVLWIENTVADAQDSFCRLAALAPGGVECGIIHSRFLPRDRATKEDLWTGYYGKDSGDRAKKGRILVGTQVLEQSLDIDSDFLVTRLCPTDMLLQRLGRLWRHEERQDRTKGARREAWLLVPPQSETPLPEHFGKSAWVYDPYVLFRSLETLAHLSSVHLPSQIRRLIEVTYAERPESGLLARLRAELEKKKNMLAGQARQARSEIGQARREGVATRYSELDSARVLLVRKLEPSKEGVRMVFLGGEAFFPNNVKARDRREWRRLACLLDSNTLAVARHHAPDGAMHGPLKKSLGGFTYIGRDEDSDLRVAIVAESGELRAMDGSGASEKYRLEYHEHLGYVAAKK
jgi:CRISPR-associated endonuclease/helicase Cas3